MADAPAPTKHVLGDFVSNLTGPAGEVLYSGNLSLTMVSKLNECSISLRFSPATAKTQREGYRTVRKYGVPLDSAEVIYVGVVNSRDRVATIFVEGKHAGTMFPAKDWDSGVIVADPARYWAARKMLEICTGDAEYETARYKVALGTECMRCGQELTEPESQAKGLGSHCAQVVSSEYGRRHQRRSRIPTPEPTLPPAPEQGSERAVQESLFTIAPGETLADVYARLHG